MLFSPSRTPLDNPPLLLSVGRISPIKDLITLVEATRLLRQRGHNLRCALVGSPPDRSNAYAEQVRQKVEVLRLGDAVQFVGPVPNHQLAQWYRRCFAHVNCSPPDHSLDKAVLEAMACERPSLSSTLGFKETMGKWADRLLFQHGNSEDLAKKIEWLLRLSDAERHAIGKDLRLSVMKRHDLEQLAGRLAALLSYLKTEQEQRRNKYLTGSSRHQAPLRKRTSDSMGKLSTGLKYVSMGLGLGSNLRSRWILASMLPRLRLRKMLGLSTSNIYTATVRVEGLESTLYFREQDIFTVREVLFGEGYLKPNFYKKPLRSIIDLGAHVGLAAIRFAAAFPEARINCYEPDPENFKLLQLNTQDLPNISLHQEAVGPAFGKANFYINPERRTAGSLKPNQRDRYELTECSVKPLDAIIEEVGTAVDLIKFDIEELEHDIFSQSRLVHQVNRLVGEIKAPSTEIDRFLSLFPSHIPEIRQEAKHMYLIYFTHKEC